MMKRTIKNRKKTMMILMMMVMMMKHTKRTFKQTCTSVAATDTVAIAVSIKLKANAIS